ncbi:hypothetical protein BLOT_002969 [Blomia tropicalis]|nr:hypothetical protein BLOT_002969 [Blomia tropicalis]
MFDRMLQRFFKVVVVVIFLVPFFHQRIGEKVPQSSQKCDRGLCEIDLNTNLKSIHDKLASIQYVVEIWARDVWFLCSRKVCLECAMVKLDNGVRTP